MSRIDCNNVWKIYGGNVVGVKDLTFTCNDKEFLAILGPSGGGKSSTLRMLAGLEEISKGEVRFDGEIVNDKGPTERNIALAFESYALYYRMNVYENIAFPLRARGMKNKEVDEKVNNIAKVLNLTTLLKKKPGELAGGHQQRVSLARALVRQPKLTLLDEPLSHMDQRLRAEIRAQIRRIHEVLGNTTIYVTHDQAEAISLCDRILILTNAEKQQIGTVDDIYNRPVNKFVANFIGQPGMNFMSCKVESQKSLSIKTSEGAKTLEIEGVVDSRHIGSEITMGIRPQQIQVSDVKSPQFSIPGIIKIIEFQGDNSILLVELSDPSKTEIRVVVPAGGIKFNRGQTCFMDFRAQFLHLFDSTEKAIVEKKA
jgi:multiple sugar transport system ATP-binding protein